VPLRDTAAFDEWVERVRPSAELTDRVWEWIRGLDATPWQAPSIPFPELSDQPEYEVRSAEVAGVDVFYRHEYATGNVDLIGISLGH
jgi:hypothetical protein